MKIYYTTTSNLNNAKSISKRFLNDKKAVCINLIKNVNSFYLDDGSINFANEIIMIIKTRLKKSEIERYICEIHNYETPLIVEIKSGLPNLVYADWFAKNAE
jgi:periplasmic divalent cation tolerance protein